MDHITIPLPNINLSLVVKRKAKTTIETHLAIVDLQNVTYQLPGYRDDLTDAIDEDLSKIRANAEKLLFISELLIHLNNIYEGVSNNKADNSDVTPIYTSDDETCLLNIQDIQYHLHSIITELGFTVDSNTMTPSEVRLATTAVEDILIKLEELKAGNEILFDRIEELKEDFEDVLTTLPLGKKTTKQRFLGILAGYFGEKGADEVYNAITPLISEILNDPSMLIG